MTYLILVGGVKWDLDYFLVGFPELHDLPDVQFDTFEKSRLGGIPVTVSGIRGIKKVQF